MKLAEALINRADAQNRIYQLRDRINRVVRVQEGDEPAENPQELLDELRRTIAQFNTLVKQINRTNANTAFSEGTTLTDALADRDALAQERSIITGLISTATAQNYRYSRTEIKQVTTVDVGELQRQADDLARRYRELDSAIQQLNWNVDLIEA